MPPLVLVRDLELNSIYADSKTDIVIGRLKDKTIHSYYGMHKEPIFCLVFENDENDKLTTMFCDWTDTFYAVAEPK
uniref:Uncharacterized protein n=1 Tax=viral metagenome TaxID=1070528 RepID=A0A6C0ARY4_9ZZZZ